MSQEYKICTLLAEKIPYESDPRGINYNTGLITRLNPLYMPKEKGRLLHTEWYAPDQDGNFTDLILDTKSVYTDRPDGRVLSRVTTRRYRTLDNEWGDIEKVSFKPYDEVMANREGVRRRTNIVNDLRDQSTLFGAKEYFSIMARIIDLDLRSYVEEGDLTLLNTIATYQDPNGIPWLEAPVPTSTSGYTIRQGIIVSLDYMSTLDPSFIAVL